MKEQVLTVEQMQELIDMGIDTSKANAYHALCAGGDYKLYFRDKYIDCDNCTPTFTLQDILEMLPHTLEFKDVYGNTHFEYIEFWGDGWNQMAVVDPMHPSSPRITTSNISPLRSAFEMLKWCKENNYI